MAEAVGYSRFYPAIPIMNVLSMVLCLLLIHGFWKTRIVALTSLVVWIFLADLMNCIGMIQWRGNTNDIPIFASFFTVFSLICRIGFLASTACFAHFTWQRLQPLSMRQLSDTRRRNNLIHFVVSVIVPILWAPLHLVSLQYRYVIIEDLGPVTSARWDWPGFVVDSAPQVLSFLAVILFNTLALVTYWRTRREDTESDLLGLHSSVRTRKLLLLALSNILLAVYGIYMPVRYWGMVELVAPTSFAENIASLQTVFHATRSIVEEEADVDAVGELIKSLLGFYLFAWFGCGEESRKVYREAIMKLVRLMGLAVEPFVGLLTSPWSCIAFRRSKEPQGLTNSLPLTHPNALQITPYISTLPGDNGPQPSATPANNNPPGSAGNIQRQGKVESREPARRLSMHKSPLAAAALNPANASFSALDVPLRRQSYHKTPSNHLVPPSVPAIDTLDASGSIPSCGKGKNKARRQENLTPRPSTRHLSYYKPAFVPLAPTHAGRAVANELGTSMPLVEMAGNLLSSEETGPQAEGAAGSGSPPPFSIFPTAIAPPRFSVLFPEHLHRRTES